MKKISLAVATLIISVAVFCGCGHVERKEESNYDNSLVTYDTNTSSKVTDSNSSKTESSEDDNSKDESSSKKEINNSSKTDSFLDSSSSKADGSSNDIVTNSSNDSRVPVLIEEVKAEMGPPPIIDITPTREEDTVKSVGTYGPQLEELKENEKIVFKPSTHYLHKSTCHWVNDECYEVTDTNNIEARICSECNPDIEVKNEYKEPDSPRTEQTSTQTYWDGPVLNPSAGVVYGPSGKETYYNLDMSGVVSIMRGMGFDAVSYPYWVRDDGVKMLGNYCIVAANLDVHPRGSLVECSLGTAIVCDTGGFAYGNPYQLDVACAW